MMITSAIQIHRINNLIAYRLIHYAYLFSMLLFFIAFMCSPCFSDDYEPNYYLIDADFEDGFPPDGWTQNKTIESFSWRKVDSAEDGTILPFQADYFAYVGGASGFSYNESLITPKIELSEWHECDLMSKIACGDTYFGEEDIFSIDISYNYDQDGFHNWTNIGYLGDSILKCDDDSEWTFFRYSAYDFQEKTFWLRFHYKGNSGIGVGLDIFCIYCDSESFNPPDDNNNNNDDNNINDNMAGSSKGADGDDEDDKGCGFAGRTFDPAAPLALFMVMVGFIFFLYSGKRHSEKKKSDKSVKCELSEK